MSGRERVKIVQRYSDSLYCSLPSPGLQYNCAQCLQYHWTTVKWAHVLFYVTIQLPLSRSDIYNIYSTILQWKMKLRSIELKDHTVIFQLSTTQLYSSKLVLCHCTVDIQTRVAMQYICSTKVTFTVQLYSVIFMYFTNVSLLYSTRPAPWWHSHIYSTVQYSTACFNLSGVIHICKGHWWYSESLILCYVYTVHLMFFFILFIPHNATNEYCLYYIT